MSKRFFGLLPIILIIVLVVSLIPLFVMSFYNHPSIDDYYYGILTHDAVSSGNITEILTAAVEQVKKTYYDWQGTYSAVFLFSLHPAIFGENFYALSTFVLLPTLILSTFLFSYVLVVKIFGAPTNTFIITASTISLLSVHLAPSAVQSYFWWNGSIYYTFFYSLTLIFFSLIYFFLNSNKIPAKILYYTVIFFLAFLIGGGNYVSALLSAIILFLITLYLVLHKNKHAIPLGILFAAFLAFFLFSIIAPGNAVRAENYSDISAISAILYSLRYAFYWIKEWTDIPFLAALFCLTPLIARAASRSRFSFKYPVFALVFLFLVFASQFAPPIYGMGEMGTGIEPANSGYARILNIIYYSYFFFAVTALYYVSGSISKKYGDFTKPIFSFLKKRTGVITVSIIILVAIYTPAAASAGDMIGFNGGNVAGFNAIHSLATGEAEIYHKDNLSRYKELTDESKTIIEFSPFSTRPKLIFYGDLTQDPDYMWSNAPMRDYFHKESVIVRWHK